MTTNDPWTPLSWKSKPIVQDVTYKDQAKVDRVIGKLHTLPPLVSSKEVSNMNVKNPIPS
jgi:3-deoxy-7-phosphoheptulonate synthase